MRTLSSSDHHDTFLQSREKGIISLLCVLAAIHVFVFSAAFPFFNNVDEAMHFDLVLKYAQGDIPHKTEAVSPDSTSYLALLSSHEYFESPDQFTDGKLPPPPWALPPGKESLDLAIRSALWQTHENYEISQTPLYYLLAGSWWHIGGALGLHDGWLVYWLRFLNIPLIIGLIWLAHATARLLFPDNFFLRLGAPALLAFMPQSAFYSIGNDMLSSLCFGLTFISFIQWLRAESPSAVPAVSTGLAFAATYLTKMTNLPELTVITVAILFKTWHDIQCGKFRENSRALAAFICCAEPPMIAWIIWCKAHFGDATGANIKTQYLGWTLKPFAQWWHHPIFSPHGFWTYLSGELGTFWQGEFWWHGPRMCLPGTDDLYTLLSLVLLAAALPALSPRLPAATSIQRHALQLSLACLVAGLGFFGLMSIIYDFHDCPNPSRTHPYFAFGRMLLGTLIPFLLLILFGLQRLLTRFGDGTKWITLGAMILAMLLLETVTNWPAFSSPYNWFHLP
jgi:hypothetical protein